MKLPKRFALSTLLLLMLVVAAVFGYAQWRRLELTSQVKSLNKSGIDFGGHSSHHHWWWTSLNFRVSDDFWAAVEPNAIAIMIYIDYSGRCSLRSTREWTTLDEAETSLKEICRTLESIGIDDVEFIIRGHVGYNFQAGPSADIGLLRATHEEWSTSYRDPSILIYRDTTPD